MNTLVNFARTLFSWFIAIVVIALAVYAIGWFITGNNAATAGDTVHDTWTSAVTFVTTAIGF